MKILQKLGMSVGAVLSGGVAALVGAYAFGAGYDLQNVVIHGQLALTLAAVGLIWWNRPAWAGAAMGVVLAATLVLLVLGSI